MDIAISNGNEFRRIINCLKELITDGGTFKFDSTGMSMCSQDTAKVVLIDILFEPESFLKYVFEVQDQELVLSFNFEHFHNAMKITKSNRIGMIYRPKKNDILSLNLSEVGDKKNYKFDMKLVNSEKPEMENREFEYDHIVYAEVNEFQQIIKNVSSFGERTKFVVTKNSMSIIVDGSTGTCDINCSDLEIVSVPDAVDYEGNFNIKYLIMFIKAAVSGEFALKFKKGVPFCFEHKLEHGHARFYICETTK